MRGYFGIVDCTPEELAELRNSYFYADDTDHAELDCLGIYDPEDVPDWLLYREYSDYQFVAEDFWCNTEQQGQEL